MRIIRGLKIMCCNPLTKQGTHPPSACLSPVMADSLLHKVAPSHCWIVVRTRRFFHVPNGHLLPWHCCVIHRRMHLTSQTPGSFPWGYRYEVHLCACAPWAFRMKGKFAEWNVEQLSPGCALGSLTYNLFCLESVCGQITLGNALCCSTH